MSTCTSHYMFLRQAERTYIHASMTSVHPDRAKRGPSNGAVGADIVLKLGMNGDDVLCQNSREDAVSPL